MENNRIGRICIHLGENRILIMAIVPHKAGYHVDSEWFITIDDITDYERIGSAVAEAIKYSKTCPPVEGLTKNIVERKVGATKYKTWLSFWRNNLCGSVEENNNQYRVFSNKRLMSPKGGYYDCVKEIFLPFDTSNENMGKAVIDVFKAAEEYHANLKR